MGNIVDSYYNVSNTKVISAFKFRFKQNWYLNNQCHDYHEIVAPLEGRLRVAAIGREIVGGPGSIFLYPKNLTHSERSIGGKVTLAWAHFVTDDWKINPHEIRFFDSQNRITTGLNWIYDLKESNITGLALNGLMAAILIQLCTSSPKMSDERITDVKDYVYKNLRCPIRLKQLADIACIGPHHFLRLFKSAIGESPMCGHRFYSVLNSPI